MATGCVGGWSSAAVPLLMSGMASDLGGIGRVTSDEASWITSLMNLGSLVGSLPAGQMSFHYGRRKFLLHSAVLLIFGWLLIINNFNNVSRVLNEIMIRILHDVFLFLFYPILAFFEY